MADDTGFVVYKGTTEGIVDAFYRTQALADAGATQSDLIAVQGEQELKGLFPNVAYWNGAKLVEDLPEDKAFEALTSQGQIDIRRETLFRKLRLHESIGAKLSVWHAAKIEDLPIGDPPESGEDERLDESKRTPSYGHWVEANTRAALIDDNLTSEYKWTLLNAECSIPGETWYWLHKVNGVIGNGGWYAIYADVDRGEWVWRYTTGTTTTSNSRIGILPLPSLLLALDTDADWVKALQ